MNSTTMNSLKKQMLSSSSTNQLNSIQEKVSSMNNELKESLGMEPDQAVNSYGVLTAKKLESEFVDVIAMKFISLKKYLQELKEFIIQSNNLDDIKIAKVVDGCENIVDTTVKASKKDGAFFELLAMPAMEIKSLIKQIKRSIPQHSSMAA